MERGGRACVCVGGGRKDVCRVGGRETVCSVCGSIQGKLKLLLHAEVGDTMVCLEAETCGERYGQKYYQ